MKYYRYTFITILLCISAFSLVIHSACKKNDCGSTSCQNGGTCVHDTCVCPTGYLGNDCATSWSTQYLGTYNCTQTCNPSTGSGAWVSSITGYSNSGQDTIQISNFAGSSRNVVAGVDNKGNIYFVPTENNGLVGGGVLSNNVLTIKYTTTSGGFNCTMIMTRQ